MAYSTAAVGASSEPVEHTVDARWLLAYAAVLEETDPRLADTRHPDGIVAHPLFPVCVEWEAMLALRRSAPTGMVGAERARGVHATHDLHVHRPVRPGDQLTTTATIVGVEARSPGTYEVVCLRTVDRSGAPVATTYMGNLFLGVALDGEPPTLLQSAVPPVSPERRKDRHTKPPWGAKTPRSLPANLGHTYTECARIWNPIHTDPAVAEAAGLPGTILHGTAVLAVALSAAWPLFGRPDNIARISAQFRGMVLPPADIDVTLLSDDRGVVGEVCQANGTAIVRNLVVERAAESNGTR
jgi:acyl dehydratase